MVKIWNIWTNSLHSDAKLILINSFLQCIRGNWEKAFLICCIARSTIVHLLLSKETTLLKETHCLKKLHCLKKPLIIKKLHCLKKLTASWHWWNNICNILVKWTYWLKLLQVLHNLLKLDPPCSHMSLRQIEYGSV